MLWARNVGVIRVQSLGGFGAITPERLGVQRAQGKIFMKFRIAAAWEGDKFYGFLLGFHAVNFVLSSRAAAKRK